MNTNTQFMTQGNRAELEKFYAFARAHSTEFATVEQFRSCGGELSPVRGTQTAEYIVETFDMNALVRAYVRHQINSRAMSASGVMRVLESV